MKRAGILFLALIALIAMTAPVSAQPKVTITGFVDNMTTYNRNISTVDSNYARHGDVEWYARTRVRPDITAEVGTTKFVLGMEIDYAWGQTGATDGSANVNPGGGPQRFGTNAGLDLNTDTSGIIEIKWAYTEFNLPLIPVPSVMRIGAQPFQTQYKLAALANGDFAGVHITNQWSPMIKSNFTWASIEEQSTGPRDGFTRGEDHALFFSVEITPFTGLDIRPIYNSATFVGVTNGAARQARGGVGTGAGVFPTAPAGGFGGATEDRHTVGIDARWRFGAFSLDPTFFYQFGHRDQVVPIAFNSGLRDTLARQAWLADIRAGWQAGPLLLEAAFIYSSGNEANERIDRNESKLKYYEPISTDTSYYAGWAEIQALGLDYFSAGREPNGSVFTGTAIGYDKYGLMRIGLRGSYALTPAFTVRAGATASWTAEDVDTSSTLTANGLTPCAGLVGAAAVNCDAQLAARNGDASYLGTELNLGFQYRFAPNVALDVVGAYQFTGNAQATSCVNLAAVAGCGSATAVNGRNPQDAQSVVARVRYSW